MNPLIPFTVRKEQLEPLWWTHHPLLPATPCFPAAPENSSPVKTSLIRHWIPPALCGLQSEKIQLNLPGEVVGAVTLVQTAVLEVLESNTEKHSCVWNQSSPQEPSEPVFPNTQRQDEEPKLWNGNWMVQMKTDFFLYDVSPKHGEMAQ